MSVDYDLVVVGGSPAGFRAATLAAQLRSRVALVTQAVIPADTSTYDHWLASAHLIEQAQQAGQLELWHGELGSRGAVAQWSRASAFTRGEVYSPANLAAQGVEVIAASGEFYRKPRTGFAVEGRSLRSRAYLLTPDCEPMIPLIDGLQQVSYQTPATLVQGADPATWVVIGAAAEGVEVAQALTRWGHSVVLISPERLLPLDDPDVAQLMQARLEAEGVKVYPCTVVTQVRQIQGKVWVQANDQAIEADEIVITAGYQPRLDWLNLEAVKVQRNQQGIVVNSRLQTTNPQIYACSSLAHRQPNYEADIATHNALFLPLRRTHYAQPQVVHSVPEIARIGLTEPLAQELYGEHIVTVRLPTKVLAQAHLQGDLTGFCKFVLHRNGTILGAHLIMPQAREMTGAIALAMHQNLKIQKLAHLPFASPSFAELIQLTAQEWQRLRLENNAAWQEILEGYFGLQRSWF